MTPRDLFNLAGDALCFLLILAAFYAALVLTGADY